MKQKLKKIAVLAVLLAAGAFSKVGNAQKTTNEDYVETGPCPPGYIAKPSLTKLNKKDGFVTLCPSFYFYNGFCCVRD